jgi:hypothetical protein
MKKLPEGEALRKRAKELGIDVDNEWNPSAMSHAVSDGEIQARILAFEEQRRQDRLWIVAVVSSAAAVISSVTALVALFLHR